MVATTHELAFRADLALTLASAAAEAAAQDPHRVQVLAHLAVLDRRIERALRRLEQVDDAAFQRAVLGTLVRDARRLLQLAVDVAAAQPGPDAARVQQYVADAQRAVDAYVRARMAELAGPLPRPHQRVPAGRDKGGMPARVWRT
jgi:hypothetical protein